MATASSCFDPSPSSLTDRVQALWLELRSRQLLRWLRTLSQKAKRQGKNFDNTAGLDVAAWISLGDLLGLRRLLAVLSDGFCE